VRFRITTATGQVLDEGQGEAEMIGDALVVSPTFGQPLRIVPSDIVGLTEPEPYVVRLTLAEGPSVELSQLGKLRTQILAQLADARGDEVADTFLLRGVGKAESFPGAVDGAEAELRLYDDALVTIPTAGPGEKVPYPFIKGVGTDASGYRVSIEVSGREPLVAQRLARRTSEFMDLLTARYRVAVGRTSSFMAALLPGLGPIALRGVAGLLRDGLAGSKADLDGIDPTIWPALVGAAVLPDRAGGVAAMAGLGDMFIGFKQTVSVEREAQGGTPWHDHSATPNLGSHDGGSSSFGGGFGGMMEAGMMSGGPPRDLGFNGPFQAMGSALAFSMLGTGGFGGGAFAGGGFAGDSSIVGAQHQVQPRANVERGRLTPAHTDHAALTAGGEAPTVMAFVLCLTRSGHLVYEVLNETDHATYVYRCADAQVAAGINRALDLVGFRVTGIYQEAESAGSPYRKAAERLPALRVLRDAYQGRVIHTESWADKLAEAVK
jgi:hypothetical protein